MSDNVIFKTGCGENSSTRRGFLSAWRRLATVCLMLLAVAGTLGKTEEAHADSYDIVITNVSYWGDGMGGLIIWGTITQPDMNNLVTVDLDGPYPYSTTLMLDGTFVMYTYEYSGIGVIYAHDENGNSAYPWILMMP